MPKMKSYKYSGAFADLLDKPFIDYASLYLQHVYNSLSAEQLATDEYINGDIFLMLQAAYALSFPLEKLIQAKGRNANHGTT